MNAFGKPQETFEWRRSRLQQNEIDFLVRPNSNWDQKKMYLFTIEISEDISGKGTKEKKIVVSYSRFPTMKLNENYFQKLIKMVIFFSENAKTEHVKFIYFSN